jgi:hypothetical protein
MSQYSGVCPGSSLFHAITVGVINVTAGHSCFRCSGNAVFRIVAGADGVSRIRGHVAGGVISIAGELVIGERSQAEIFPRVDKSEGAVKGKLFLAMRKHRDSGQRTLTTKTLVSIFESLLESPFKGTVLLLLLLLPFHQPSIRSEFDHDSSIRTPNLQLGARAPNQHLRLGC